VLYQKRNGTPDQWIQFASSTVDSIGAHTRRSLCMAPRLFAASVATVLALGFSSVLAQQAAGVIAGRATDEARQPFSDYSVQLRDVASGQIAATKPLNGQGQFDFDGLPLARQFLVELYDTREKKVVCTEGPYRLAATAPSRTDVNIDCGKVPAAAWLLAAGAGTAAAIALTTTSTSN
jgi:hypothetical protein